MKTWTVLDGAPRGAARCSRAAVSDGTSSRRPSRRRRRPRRRRTWRPRSAPRRRRRATRSRVGLLNLESGPVTFPEYRQAAEAAVKYINDYKGGIGGRPVQLELCATDAQPRPARAAPARSSTRSRRSSSAAPTSARPGAFPVYEKAKLAYLGGIPFTPVESNAPNAVQFISISIGDNRRRQVRGRAARRQEGVGPLHRRHAGQVHRPRRHRPGAEGPGRRRQGRSRCAPSAADLSSVAASAIEKQPDMIYVNSPNACPRMLKALKAVGNTAKIAGIELCTSPPALKTAGDAAEGIILRRAVRLARQPAPTTPTCCSRRWASTASKDVALDSIAQAGFSSVMNVQERLNGV